MGVSTKLALALADARIESMGGVLAAQFEAEDQVVVFLPESGDVLLCAAAQWRELNLAPASKPPASGEGSELRATLRHLGVRLP
jgi:hypothetical protein